MAKKTLTFDYRFKREDGSVNQFRIELDPASLEMILPAKKGYPEWTKLTFHQCANCPLKPESDPYCPIAKNLSEIIEFFKSSISFEEVDVEITTPARTYSKHTSLQDAMSSLIGIFMVTSGCPVMDKLRPMVRTHLPFATLEESMYRALSMYLMAQYFIVKHGGTPDWNMHDLVNIFQDVRVVNNHFFKRIAKIQVQEASLNAVVHLDCFANFTSSVLLEKNLDEMEKMFAAYFR